MKGLKYIFLVIAASLCCSCVFKNDMDYPKVVASITAFEVDGMKNVTINEAARTVTVDLEESTDMSHLKITKFEVSQDAEIVEEIPEYIDLTSDRQFTLQTYQKYSWTIRATQTIDRYIVCKEQVGDAEFNVEERMAYVYVNSSQPLSAIEIEDMKLEADDSEIISTTGTVVVDETASTVTEEVNFPMTLNCVVVRHFDVLLGNGGHVDWSVKFLNKEMDLSIKSVNAWAHKADISGEFAGTGTPVLEYKLSAKNKWQQAAEVVIDKNSLSASIDGLMADRAYDLRFINGEEISAVFSFTTEKEEQLDNSSFDNWYQDMGNSGCWFPYLADGLRIWDTANKGTLITGSMPTIPETKDVVKGSAAHLITTEALGLLAAGNMYTGVYGKLSGLGAELDWGVPFTSRPKALKGWYKYSPKPIDRTGTAANKDKYKDYLGTSDKCQIQVMISDWDKPFHVNSAKEEFVDFDNDPGVIAFGKFESDLVVNEWTEFVLPLEYRDFNRKAKYIIVTACGSYLGNFYVGGTGSEMWIDEFELVY